MLIRSMCPELACASAIASPIMFRVGLAPLLPYCTRMYDQADWITPVPRNHGLAVNSEGYCISDVITGGIKRPASLRNAVIDAQHTIDRSVEDGNRILYRLLRNPAAVQVAPTPPFDVKLLPRRTLGKGIERGVS